MHDNLKNKHVFWSRKMLEYFIQLYKQHECLYDIQHTYYDNRCQKMEASNNILQKMRKFIPDLQMDDVRVKIKAIRTQLSNEFTQIDEAEATGTQYVPKLWCFEQLSFLHKHMAQLSEDNNEPKEDDTCEVLYENDDTESDGGNSQFSEFNQLKHKRKYVWSREDTLFFIEIFKEYPILYDPNHKNYKNRNRRDEARQKILNDMQGLNTNITLNDVCLKITTLRCQYTRELRRLALAEKNHTSYLPKFWCFNELSFLNNKDMVVKRIEDYEEEYLAQSNNNTINNSEENFDAENTIHNETLNEEQLQQNMYSHKVEIERDEKLTNSQNELLNETEHINDDTIPDIIGNEQYLIGHDPDGFITNDNEQTTPSSKRLRYFEEITNVNKKETKDVLKNVISTESNETTKRKVPTDSQDGKFKWLGELVVEQIDDISPTLRNDFAWDVQCLIRKYILKTREEQESLSLPKGAQKSQSTQDVVLPKSSNISLNISIL